MATTKLRRRFFFLQIRACATDIMSLLDITRFTSDPFAYKMATNNVASIVKACLSLSKNYDTNNDLITYIRSSLPPATKTQQLFWLKHHVRKGFNDGIIRNYSKEKPMAATHVINKWKDLLCYIFPDNATKKTLTGRKNAAKRR